jgi:hypothetical protein
MVKILLLLGFLQLIRYLFPHDDFYIGSSGLQSRLFDQFISLLTVRKSMVEMTIQKLGKNNKEKFPPWLPDYSSYGEASWRGSFMNGHHKW